MTVVIEGSELPGRTCRPEPDGQGHQDVYVALGGRSEDRPALTMSNKPGMAIEPVPGDAPAARWEMPSRSGGTRTASTSAGRSCAASAMTATSG
jgi:hypothetical protein